MRYDPAKAGQVLPEVAKHVNGVDCPIDPSLPECRSTDKGCVVVRSAECIAATARAHFDCRLHSHLADVADVYIRDPFGGCNWGMALRSVSDCSDHIEIRYSVTKPCAPCDGTAPSVYLLGLPNDGRPVWAEGELVQTPCDGGAETD